MKKTLDHPFNRVVMDAGKLIAEGATVYQKYTCAGCGARLGMEEPNVFHTRGTCDQCDAITDIRKNGCNYMAVWGSKL
jgi:hypothetical protein